MNERLRDERGIAVVTAMLLAVVMVTVSLTVVSLSLHNSNVSSQDRKRIQAIDAAEAGINASFVTLGVVPSASLPCTVDADLPTSPTAHYHVELSYYASYPPTGVPMACPPLGPPAAPPKGVQIVSKGTAVQVGSPTAVSRTMETLARLTPIFAPFGQAIFVNSDLDLTNNLDVIGNQGNDGDIYVNGSWTCTNSSFIRGSIIAQGSAIMGNSCTVAQDLNVKLAIAMSNSATVNHDAISATSSITMSNNTHVFNNATSGTTCTGCTTGAGGRVSGTATPNHLSPPPPVRPFPILNFDQAAWVTDGYTIKSYDSTQCAAAQTFINDTGTPATKYAVRISPACTITWGNNSVINIRADMAIISDGSLITENKTTWKSADGISHTLFMIVPYSAGTTCPVGVHDIIMSNNTTFTNLKLLLYTPCEVSMSNNNNGQGGQIFGGTVDISNLYSLTFRPILVPGAGDVSGFNVDIAYLREIINR